MRILDNLWHFIVYCVNRLFGKIATLTNNRLEKLPVVQMSIGTNGLPANILLYKWPVGATVSFTKPSHVLNGQLERWPLGQMTVWKSGLSYKCPLGQMAHRQISSCTNGPWEQCLLSRKGQSHI